MFRKLALAALVLTACSAQPPSQGVGSTSEAIIGGQNDGTMHPSVVMLYVSLTDSTGAQSGAICTGEVVSPHVVLTAAHCVDPAAMTDSSGNPLTINSFVVYLGDDITNDMELSTPGNLRKVNKTVFNPAFDINNLQGGNDIAVVITTTTIPETPMAFSMTALDPTVYTNKTVTLVGYGIDSGSDSMGTSAGIRRYTTTKISSIMENSSGTGQLIQLGSATHNTCHGDSGGPAIYTDSSGKQTIIGITSYGDPSCASYGDDTDVGSYYTSWLQNQITMAEANAAPDPTPDMSMPTAVVDMAGSTSSNGDAGSSGNGNGSGNVDASTGNGNGNGNGNGSTGNGAKTVGETCSSSTQCASGICTEGSAHYCTQTCELNVNTSCPVNMTCQLVGNMPYCVVPTKSSGCSAASGAGSAPGPAGALGGILLLLSVAFGLRFSTRRL